MGKGTGVQPNTCCISGLKATLGRKAASPQPAEGGEPARDFGAVLEQSVAGAQSPEQSPRPRKSPPRGDPKDKPDQTEVSRPDAESRPADAGRQEDRPRTRDEDDKGTAEGDGDGAGTKRTERPSDKQHPEAGRPSPAADTDVRVHPAQSVETDATSQERSESAPETSTRGEQPGRTPEAGLAGKARMPAGGPTAAPRKTSGRGAGEPAPDSARTEAATRSADGHGPAASEPQRSTPESRTTDRREAPREARPRQGAERVLPGSKDGGPVQPPAGKSDSDTERNLTGRTTVSTEQGGRKEAAPPRSAASDAQRIEADRTSGSAEAGEKAAAGAGRAEPAFTGTAQVPSGETTTRVQADGTAGEGRTVRAERETAGKGQPEVPTPQATPAKSAGSSAEREVEPAAQGAAEPAKARPAPTPVERPHASPGGTDQGRGDSGNSTLSRDATLRPLPTSRSTDGAEKAALTQYREVQAAVAADRPSGGEAAPAEFRAAVASAVQQTESHVVRNAQYIQSGGRSEVRLQLDPPELGRMKVEIELRDGDLEVRIRVENPEVREAIRGQLQSLERSLRDVHVEVSRFDVSDYHAGQRNSSGGGWHSAPSSGGDLPPYDGQGLAEVEEGGWVRISETGRMDCLV